jgi:glycosyltransferase involved in cell wall biosynthesis
MLVHVTHFNDLMWDSGRTPTRVIEHGVCVSAAIRYRGDIERGIVVINELARRGRRLGADLFETVRRRVPLDLVGIGAEELGGLGEVRPRELASFESRYRFFFHPVRYTSLGLALCEAMQVGMPIVGLATTELPTVIEDGVQGFIATDVERLIESMGLLIADHGLARTLGAAARARGRERFGIERFARDWRAVIDEVCGRTSGRSPRRARTRIGATRPRSARQGTTRAPRRQPDATGR